ncbi:RNA polymerase sigma factor [Pseudonocardia lacus]|uniref:RNA polymerase sigma factor n=1 Tax=Pseudonocardia lacus TaxID=2835865 RepID=UPI001BDD6B43|nr:RNA polymerase sigma factor [Pseudonocardia lacus]
MLRAAAEARAGARRGRADADLQEALRAAQAGDEAGFTVLYRHLQPRLLRYATALVGADAEDVTAETWLNVAKGVRDFVGDLDGFRGWVSTICRNRAIDVTRRRGRRASEPVDLDALTALPDRQDASDSALGDLATRWAVDRILELPRTEAEAVLLRAVIGLDAVRAGEVLGKRPGTVRVAAHRGLRRLARMLEADGWTAGDQDG